MKKCTPQNPLYRIRVDLDENLSIVSKDSLKCMEWGTNDLEIFRVLWNYVVTGYFDYKNSDHLVLKMYKYLKDKGIIK